MTKLFLSLILLSLYGCHSTTGRVPVVTQELEVEKNEGVVDGSGGNVVRTSYEEFEKVVNGQLPALVRDLVDRSHLYFSFAEEEKRSLEYSLFHSISEDVENLFLSNQSKSKDIYKDITYKPKKGPCLSTNHGGSHTDAAINDKGEMCLSYESFKRFKDEELLKNLLIMSMHEVSHKFGYDEDKAQVIQDFYEISRAGKSLILVGNDETKVYQNYVNAKTRRINYAMGFINQGMANSACIQLYSVYGIDDDLFESTVVNLPHYYTSLESRESSSTLDELYELCVNIFDKKATDKEMNRLKSGLYEIYESRNKFIKEYENFLYPILKDTDIYIYSDLLELDHPEAIRLKHRLMTPVNDDNLFSIMKSCKVLNEKNEDVLKSFKVVSIGATDHYEIETTVKRVLPKEEMDYGPGFVKDEHYKFIVSLYEDNFIDIMTNDLKIRTYKAPQELYRAEGSIKKYLKKNRLEIKFPVLKDDTTIDSERVIKSYLGTKEKLPTAKTVLSLNCELE